MSIRVGTNDIGKARAFYNATLPILGGSESLMPDTAPIGLYKLSNGQMFLVGPAADGEPATAANGGTILLIASDEAAVDAWYAAGMENGGIDEGKPGPRPQVQGRYGAYMRDPDGNKFGCYVGNLFG
ncbi:VOC family protein [Novosphingobium pentaromativorans]|nr:VOC family protein [Novosphingobium pentaromativorans]